MGSSKYHARKPPAFGKFVEGIATKFNDNVSHITQSKQIQQASKNVVAIQKTVVAPAVKKTTKEVAAVSKQVSETEVYKDLKGIKDAGVGTIEDVLEAVGEGAKGLGSTAGLSIPVLVGVAIVGVLVVGGVIIYLKV